jgi:hypothetical protein
LLISEGNGRVVDWLESEDQVILDVALIWLVASPITV